MGFSFFVAMRYFFSKKELKVINIISLISLIGVGVVTMALLVVLSVFNGFTSLASDMLSYSNPDLIVVPNKGKVLDLKDINIQQIAKLSQVQNCSPVIKESVLISCENAQSIVDMYGVQEEYFRISNIDTTMYIGNTSLYTKERANCILGYSLMLKMSLYQGAEKMNIPIQFCIPKKNPTNVIVPEDNLNIDKVLFSGSFVTRSEMDDNVAIVPLKFAQDLMEFPSNQVSSLHIKLNDSKKTNQVKAEVEKLIPENYVVKDRLEQDPVYYKVVKAEKLAVYIILGFIIFIASFNIMGALSLLIMTKSKDIMILRTMGATKRDICKIFFTTGVMMSLIGMVCGLILGIIFCLLQQHFGIIKMGASYIIESFPIKIYFTDIIAILLMVVTISCLCTGLMSRKIKFNK
ncbi:MAG: ABC transporter permease [Bacteroidales bacterium]|nr:ABC transporter permease [Bacteroidales bacterium]